jgi:malonyl-CoA O-methyltransferase
MLGVKDERSPLQKAVGWIKNNRIPKSGIKVHHKTKTVTPEVTGYIISSLYNAGEKELAIDLAKWEASIQRPDGGFAAPGSSVPYTFDTAQIIRGFLSVVDDAPQLEGNLRRACDYVEKYIEPNGYVGSESYAMWTLPDGTMLSEYGNLYVLPPMLEAGKKLNEPRYSSSARRGMDYFRQKPDLVEFKPELAMLSHYFGYMMEALVDLGEVELARKGLAQALRVQREDGMIPAFPGTDWVCATGISQIGLAWAKLGEMEPARKAMSYLEKIQNPSGGFYGGYGKKVPYFPGQEISWAAKFFIDFCLLMGKK